MTGRTLLITRPEYDITTRYISRWSEKIIEAAKVKAVNVVDLRKTAANRSEFSGRVSKLGPSLIILNGHGDQESVTGHDGEVLVKSGENSSLLEKTITYAVSCDSAAILGKEVAKQEGTVYIGYQESFVFNYSLDKIGRPLEDERAKPFMESSNHVAISLLKGHSCEESSARSKEMFGRNMRRFLSSQADPDALAIAQNLWWDMKYQACLGEGQMRLL